MAVGRVFEVTSAASTRSAAWPFGKRARDQGRLFGNRLQPQCHLRDDAERAERAGEQLAKVVAGDVLDDAAAAFELAAPRPSTALMPMT